MGGRIAMWRRGESERERERERESVRVRRIPIEKHGVIAMDYKGLLSGSYAVSLSHSLSGSVSLPFCSTVSQVQYLHWEERRVQPHGQCIMTVYASVHWWQIVWYSCWWKYRFFVCVQLVAIWAVASVPHTQIFRLLSTVLVLSHLLCYLSPSYI